MFRLESKQDPLHALLEPIGQGAVQGFGESLKKKKMADILSGLNEESPSSDWIQAISAMPVSDAERKMAYEYVGKQMQQKQARKAAEEQAFVDQQKNVRKSQLIKKSHGGAAVGDGGVGQDSSEAAPQALGVKRAVPSAGPLSPEEEEEYAALMGPAALDRYLTRQQPKAPAGGVTAQAVPPQISESIERVLTSNPKASADTLKLKMDQAGVPPIYSNEYIENRREQQKAQTTVDEATERKIDRSYERTKEFRDKTTSAYRSWNTDTQPRLLQMQILNDKNLASSSTVAFAESIGLPVSLFSNPDTELYDKLSHELLKGLPDTFGSRILKVEVDNFLRTIPTLDNSVDGRRRIIASSLKIGEMRKALYDEMRSLESEYEDQPLPRDFEQKAVERAEPRMQQITKEFTELSKIRDTPAGHTLYFSPDSQAIWVPNTQEDRFQAEQNGMRPAYMSSPGEPRRAKAPAPARPAGQAPTPDQGAEQGMPPPVAPEQMAEMEEASEADPGSRYIVASEYVDPEQEFLRDESMAGYALRNAAGMASSAASGALGVPGEIVGAVRGVFDWLMDPIFEGFVGKEKMNDLREVRDQGLKLPTSSDIKGAVDTATGGYTAPKTKSEGRAQTLASDLGSVAASPGRALVGKALGKAAGKTMLGRAAAKSASVAFAPTVGNAAQIISEEILGFSPEKSELVKAAVWMGADMAKLVSGKTHAASLCSDGRKGFTKFDRANPSRYMKGLDEATKGMLLNDPRSSHAMSQINGIRNDYKLGNLTVNDLMTRYDAINAAKRDAGMFTLGQSDRKFATMQLDKVLDVVRKEIHEAGKSNPNALESWQKGMQAFAVIHQGEAAARFAERAISGHAGRINQGVAGLFLGGLGKAAHAHPAGAAVSAVALPAVYKTAQILHRVATNESLRKYYWESMKALVAQDSPSFLKNFNKLQEGYEKKYGKEPGEKHKASQSSSPPSYTLPPPLQGKNTKTSPANIQKARDDIYDSWFLGDDTLP